MSKKTINFCAIDFQNSLMIKHQSRFPGVLTKHYRQYSNVCLLPSSGEKDASLTEDFYRYSSDEYADGIFELHDVCVFDNWGIIKEVNGSLSPNLIRGFGWTQHHLNHLVSKGYFEKLDGKSSEYGLSYEISKHSELSGTTCLMSFPGALTFGHWFFDVIGRMLSIPPESLEHIDQFLFPAPHQQWMTPFFDTLDIPKSKVKYLTKERSYGVERLIVPTVPSQGTGGVVSRQIMENILELCGQSKLSRKCKLVPMKHDVTLLYHTPMSSSASRILGNLDEVYSYLVERKINVKKVDPTKRSLSETLEVMSASRICIGQDSSALHNLIYAPNDLIVIETEKRRNMLHLCVQAAADKKVAYINSVEGPNGWNIAPQNVYNLLCEF